MRVTMWYCEEGSFHTLLNSYQRADVRFLPFQGILSMNECHCRLVNYIFMDGFFVGQSACAAG